MTGKDDKTEEKEKKKSFATEKDLSLEDRKKLEIEKKRLERGKLALPATLAAFVKILEEIKVEIHKIYLEQKKSNELYERAVRVKESTEESELTPAELDDEGYIVKATELFPEDLEAMLTFVVEEDYVRIAPRQYLGSENFAKIAAIIRDNGGEYKSAGKNSHFRMPKEELN